MTAHQEEVTAVAGRSVPDELRGDLKPGAAGVAGHMEVMGSCGGRLGVVGRVDGGYIELTPGSGGEDAPHRIPLGWVEGVSDRVWLTRRCEEAKRDWLDQPPGVR